MRAAVICLLLFAIPADAAEPAQSIARSHRVVTMAAYNIDRAGAKIPLDDLRRSIVRNLAARIALAKHHDKAAMFLTLDARRLARDILHKIDEETSDSWEASDEEIAAAAGGAGKDADAATLEADKKILSADKLKERLLEVEEIDHD
jgi:hypothetical protein